MVYLRRAIYVAALTAAVCSAPRVADACSCAIGPYVQLPEDGSLDVPTNARVWISYDYDIPNPEDVRIVRASDSQQLEVVIDVLETAQGATIVSFAPDPELDPMTEYQVFSMEATEPSFRFTTGLSRDDEAPAPPRVTATELDSRRPDPGNSCGEGAAHTAAFDLEFDGVLAIMDRDGTTTVTDTPNGTITEASPQQRLLLGSAGCLWNWPEAEGGAEATVRFAAFDLAGNFSGWNDDTEVTLEHAPGTRGCSVDGGSGAGPLGFAALLGLLAFARRRSR